MLNRLIVSIFKALLFILDKLFILTRKRVIPLYPYDKKTQTITLPKEVKKELRRMVSRGDKIEAVRQVTRLTGAGLRISKGYVDNLAQVKRVHR